MIGFLEFSFNLAAVKTVWSNCNVEAEREREREKQREREREREGTRE